MNKIIVSFRIADLPTRDEGNKRRQALVESVGAETKHANWDKTTSFFTFKSEKSAAALTTIFKTAAGLIASDILLVLDIDAKVYNSHGMNGDALFPDPPKQSFLRKPIGR